MADEEIDYKDSVIKEEIEFVTNEAMVVQAQLPVILPKEELDIEEHDVLLDPRAQAALNDLPSNDMIFVIGAEEIKTSIEFSIEIKEERITDKDSSILDERLFSSKVVLEDCRHKLQRSGCYCVHCEVLFSSCSTYNEHSCSVKKKTKKPTTDKRYKCNQCDYKCNDNSALQLHNRIHTKEKPFKCNHCSYESTQSAHLKRHLTVHTKERSFKCDFCDYKCSESGSLKKHLRIHTKVKPFKCDLCDYRSTQKCHLKYHIESKHLLEKKFKCDLCDYRCNKSSSIKAHHVYIHTKEKRLKCNLCSYKCSEKTALKRHIRTHTQTKPFKCNMCQYRCNHSWALKCHMRTIHSMD